MLEVCFRRQRDVIKQETRYTYLVHPPHKAHRIETDQHQNRESCDPRIAWQCSIDSDSTVVLQSRLLQTLV